MKTKTSPSRSANTCGDAGGVTRDGQPCGATLGLSATNGRCVMHDPVRQPERDALQRTGTTAAATKAHATRAARESNRPAGLPPPPQTIADAMRYASWALDAVAQGPDGGGIDVRRAREIAVLLRQFQSSAEKAELVARVKQLEAALKKARKELERRDA